MSRRAPLLEAIMVVFADDVPASVDGSLARATFGTVGFVEQ